MLDILPNELFGLVCSNVGSKEMCSLSCVSKTLRGNLKNTLQNVDIEVAASTYKQHIKWLKKFKPLIRRLEIIVDNGVIGIDRIIDGLVAALLDGNNISELFIRLEKGVECKIDYARIFCFMPNLQTITVDNKICTCNGSSPSCASNIIDILHLKKAMFADIPMCFIHRFLRFVPLRRF